MIFYFVKFFEEQKYADDFLNGILYINRLSFFKKIEDDVKTNRGDKYEGVHTWLQPNMVELQFGNIAINPKDLAAPVCIQKNIHDNLNVFCLYAGHTGGLVSGTEEKLRQQLTIREDNLHLGDQAVIVTKPEKFLNRVKDTVRVNNYGMKAKIVEYYDPEKFHGSFNEDDVIFKKRFEFQHQSEYRIAVDTRTNGNTAIRLDIGNIGDIAQQFDIQDFNKEFKFDFKE